MTAELPVMNPRRVRLLEAFHQGTLGDLAKVMYQLAKEDLQMCEDGEFNLQDQAFRQGMRNSVTAFLILT
jgi:hypothetical protein